MFNVVRWSRLFYIIFIHDFLYPFCYLFGWMEIHLINNVIYMKQSLRTKAHNYMQTYSYCIKCCAFQDLFRLLLFFKVAFWILNMYQECGEHHFNNYFHFFLFYCDKAIARIFLCIVLHFEIFMRFGNSRPSLSYV